MTKGKFTMRNALIAVAVIVPMLMSFCMVIATAVFVIGGPMVYFNLIPKPEFLSWSNKEVKISEETFNNTFTLEVNADSVLPVFVKIISLRNNQTTKLTSQTNTALELGQDLETGKYRLEIRYGNEEEFFDVEKIR